MRVGRVPRRELHRGVGGVAGVRRVRVRLGVHGGRTVGRILVVSGLLVGGESDVSDVDDDGGAERKIKEEQMRGLRLTGGEGEATCSEDAEGAGELCMAAIGGGDG